MLNIVSTAQKPYKCFYFLWSHHEYLSNPNTLFFSLYNWTECLRTTEKGRKHLFVPLFCLLYRLWRVDLCKFGCWPTCQRDFKHRKLERCICIIEKTENWNGQFKSCQQTRRECLGKNCCFAFLWLYFFDDLTCNHRKQFGIKSKKCACVWINEFPFSIDKSTKRGHRYKCTLWMACIRIVHSVYHFGVTWPLPYQTKWCRSSSIHQFGVCRAIHNRSGNTFPFVAAIIPIECMEFLWFTCGHTFDNRYVWRAFWTLFLNFLVRLTPLFVYFAPRTPHDWILTHDHISEYITCDSCAPIRSIVCIIFAATENGLASTASFTDRCVQFVCLSVLDHICICYDRFWCIQKSQRGIVERKQTNFIQHCSRFDLYTLPNQHIGRMGWNLWTAHCGPPQCLRSLPIFVVIFVHLHYGNHEFDAHHHFVLLWIGIRHGIRDVETFINSRSKWFQWEMESTCCTKSTIIYQ